MGKDLFNDRISRFSIRKLNVGVCSVLLGTLVMVGTAASAAAEEKTDTTNESVAAVATASEAPATSTATSATSTAETTSTAATTYEAAPAVTSTAASTSEVSSTSTAASATSTAAATSETPNLEATTTVNKAAEAASTTTDKKEEVASGIAASTTETPAVTAETSGARRRTRRALGDANDPTLIGDDVEDATSTPKVAKPGFTTNVSAADLASQISWLDFGDTANWTGTTTTSKGELALQVGATYTKEIMPGYVVKIKVKSLKPFQATEIYKKRLE